MSSLEATTNERLLTVALTPGEPAGVGLDLVLMLGQADLPFRLVLLTDPDSLVQRADLIQLPANIEPYSPASCCHRAGHFCVLPLYTAERVVPGKLATANAGYVLACLDRAIQGCLDGEFDALVTGPVHKGIINDAGVPFTGHTEYLARGQSGVRPVMMLTTGEIRAALVTTHVALREVPALITRENVAYVIDTVYRSLQTEFGVAKPRIAVCGLNPHAGEGGHLGREEIDTIAPVLEEARRTGKTILGPVPADTAFTPALLEQVDAVVAMYHDQGLTGLKALGFGQAVNITLGLPFIRTSVDHGTALDLAGLGMANVDSLREALELAVNLAANRRLTSDSL